MTAMRHILRFVPTIAIDLMIPAPQTQQTLSEPASKTHNFQILIDILKSDDIIDFQ